MKGSAYAIFIVCLFLSWPTAAVDKDGYFRTFGYGKKSCGVFMDSRKNASSVDYLAFASWAGGYLTAYNRWTSNTFSIIPGGADLAPVMLWVENYCKANPLNEVVDAMDSLIIESQSKKETVMPHN